MLTVLTWLWEQPGGRATYTARHVNIWADMVRRNLAQPHRIACVTDLADGIDRSIEIIAPPREFEDWRIPTWGPKRPQCLRRVVMFAPDAGKVFGDRFVCMDLDVVIAGALDPLFEGDHEFRIFRGTSPGRLYNGSMMLIKAGARPAVYERFDLDGAVIAGRKYVGSDQAWISYVLGAGQATWGPEDGVYWYGHHPRAARDCRVMFYPGIAKPWDIISAGRDEFVANNYRRNPAGSCLVLGYGPTVWDDLARVDDRKFDAVIASPEAAAHWPGDVLAIADDDRHAERIAAMHGFAEMVFCGRSNEGVEHVR